MHTSHHHNHYTSVPWQGWQGYGAPWRWAPVVAGSQTPLPPPAAASRGSVPPPPRVQGWSMAAHKQTVNTVSLPSSEIDKLLLLLCSPSVPPLRQGWWSRSPVCGRGDAGQRGVAVTSPQSVPLRPLPLSISTHIHTNARNPKTNSSADRWLSGGSYREPGRAEAVAARQLLPRQRLPRRGCSSAGGRQSKHRPSISPHISTPSSMVLAHVQRTIQENVSMQRAHVPACRRHRHPIERRWFCADRPCVACRPRRSAPGPP